MLLGSFVMGACAGMLAGLPLAGLSGWGKPPRVAVTRLSDVDEDFAFQGEYHGTLRSRCGWRTWGLQVRAQGDGRFAARGFPGGLPGNGWSGEAPWQWQGRRQEGAVRLLGSRGSVLLQAGQAHVADADGQWLGQFNKVERSSATLGAAPPRGALVLFGDGDLSEFARARLSDDGLLAAGAVTRRPVRDFRLHLEFRLPYMPFARGQGRGNSGVYIQQRYEVQILDSFALPPMINGCAALYKQTAPRLNMCFPPLAWQTFDIWFTAARWDSAGNKICPARITVWHNGQVVHAHQTLPAKTGAGKPEAPEPGPIRLQFHGNPVVFRNVWLVPLDSGSVASRTGTAARCWPRRGRLLSRLRAGRCGRFRLRCR